MSSRPRVLLLIPTTSYRTEDFLTAAHRLGVDVTVASEEESSVSTLNPSDFVTLDFSRPHDAAQVVARLGPITTVVGVDDATTVVASAIAEELSLPFNRPEAVRASRDKLLMRRILAREGVPQPWFHDYALHQVEEAARQVDYPCVLKPRTLAGSRGVIRADDGAQLREAWLRITRILQREDVTRTADDPPRILVEEYVPGWEVALEGFLRDGVLQTLAIFDKPDPLEGPHFAETIYVTPSRRDTAVQDALARTTFDACRALGLERGPVHAELRGSPDGLRFIEIAARSIGGLCSRALRFGVGQTLEELIIRGALDEDVSGLERESRAAGVAMLPVPRSGRLTAIEGVSEVESTPGIEEVTITVRPGQSVEALPEGALYLGFVVSRGTSPGEVETVLRRAMERIRFLIDPAG